jgi:SAM-dependent methyltransferase
MSNREPDTEGRRHDDWTCLDAPDAAAAAIAKLEALGLSAAEVAARDSYLGLLDLRPGQTVLDVGGGTGCSAIEIARRVGRTGRVVALDPSVPLGAFGREAATRAGVGEVLEWRLGSAEALPFPDGTFDRAFCRWVLLHVEAAEAVVREMRRVVRPGGRIMCVEADWETVTVYPGERGLTRRILNFLDRPAHRGLEQTPARAAAPRLWPRQRRRAADRHGRRRRQWAGVGGVPAPARRYGGFSQRGERSRGGLMAPGDRPGRRPAQLFLQLTQFAAWGDVP